MKYIRTKDELGVEREDGTCCFKTWAANPNSPLKEDWLYADTIEELCDMFISVSSIAKVINNRLENIKILANKGDTIYGAIWTDEGLIFVAKLNEKGELELL